VNFAREGLPLIAVATLVAVGAYAVALNRRSWPLWLLAFLLTVVAIWVAYFFRDPERSGARGDAVVVAPADGKVVLITEVDEPTFLQSRALRVSIFMNVFSVHVNRYPVSGVVRHVTRSAGKFLNAAADAASLVNEQNSVGLECSCGRSRGSSRVASSRTATRATGSTRGRAWASSGSGPASTSSCPPAARSAPASAS
jgi:phosphatidylserine decarboxylase